MRQITPSVRACIHAERLYAIRLRRQGVQVGENLVVIQMPLPRFSAEKGLG